MSCIISFSVVKAIKCSLFGNTGIEAVLYLTSYNTEQNFQTLLHSMNIQDEPMIIFCI